MNKQKLNTPDFWNKKLSENYKYINKSSVYKHKLKIIIDELKNASGEILDVGIGYGFIENLIIQNRLKLNINGIDISKFAINKARKTYNGRYVIGNITKLPFKNKQFDYILALDILEHLSDENIKKGLNEIYRVSKKTSKLIISIPLNENDHDSKENQHVQKFKLEELKQILSKHGFRILKKYELISYSKYYYLKNFINKIIKISKPNLLILICKKK